MKSAPCDTCDGRAGICTPYSYATYRSEGMPDPEQLCERHRTDLLVGRTITITGMEAVLILDGLAYFCDHASDKEKEQVDAIIKKINEAFSKEANR